jgi:2-keto-4-pentenoate hydratase
MNSLPLSGSQHCASKHFARNIRTMSDSALATFVGEMSAALLEARATRVAIAPLTDAHPKLSIADAYAIAKHGVEVDVSAGARVVGQKIGLTAVAVQEQLGVDSPDYGTLLSTMEIEDGGTLRLDEYVAPRVELEIAFRLGKSIRGPGVTAEDVRAATASVHPAIEVVDSRISDWRIKLADTVADRASSAAFVVGSQSLAVDQIDLTDIAVELRRNGEVVESGSSRAVLGDPAVAVVWLANALGELGETLDAGAIVLSGACTRMVTIAPGDEYTATYGDLGELSLAVS